MSQANSELGEDPFATATIDQPYEEEGMMAEQAVDAPEAPRYRKQDFSIYSVMLIMSFVFLTAAAIMFFIDADKY